MKNEGCPLRNPENRRCSRNCICSPSRICARLGVQFPGATRPATNLRCSYRRRRLHFASGFLPEFNSYLGEDSSLELPLCVPYSLEGASLNWTQCSSVLLCSTGKPLHHDPR